MTVHRYSSSSPSLGTIISVMSVLFYCAGFIRVEMKLNQHEGRISAIENVVTADLPNKNRAEVLTNKNNAEHSQSAETSYVSYVVEIPPEEFHMNRIPRRRRHVDSGSNTSATTSKISKLLSEMKLHLCQTKGEICPAGVPGPPGPPGPRGEKGARGKRGHKGRAGNKGDTGIMGSPGKSGKQGIMGPAGLIGQTGPKGEKGDMGAGGMPGMKGEPGESISSPTLIVSPKLLTVNESKSALFQCSVSGNPEPTVTWSKLSSPTVISESAISGGKLHLMNVIGNDSGVYQCTTANILGQARGLALLIVNVRPDISLHPGPTYVQEGSNITLPKCHVIGYPPPVVTWSRVVDQLPQGRVQSKSNQLTIFDVQKVDSDTYFCKASNLLGTVIKQTLVVVVQLPKFIVKPPSKMAVLVGGILTLNCSATGDPQPVITWERQGAQLPLGRTHRTNDALIIRDVTPEDAGNYICVAVSAAVFAVKAFSSVQVVYSDCSSLLKAGHTQSGVYSVDPDGQGAFSVYCDMRTDGGGWTVFQRRQDGSVDFYRGWSDYKSGFGQLTAEFWLGNDKIHRLTASRASSLRVELEDWSRNRVYAKYGKFSIGDEQAQYRLTVGSYSGSAGDSLAYHNNMAFTTKNRDHDRYRTNCAVLHTGAWWYNACHYSNLNGQYLGNKVDVKGARWHHYRDALSLKFTEMKLRPSS